MKSILFYFDYVSPYSYLAAVQLPALLGRTSAALICEPVLFKGLLNAHGQKGPAEIPAKRSYTYKDCLRLAKRYGVPLRVPPAHPFNPLASLRMTLAIESDRRWNFVCLMMNEVWGKGEDVTRKEILIALADQLKLNGSELWELAQSPQIKEALRRNTEEAIRKGVFGVPSFLVGEELFWGSDRMEFLELFLKGEL